MSWHRYSFCITGSCWGIHHPHKRPATWSFNIFFLWAWTGGCTTSWAASDLRHHMAKKSMIFSQSTKNCSLHDNNRESLLISSDSFISNQMWQVFIASLDHIWVCKAVPKEWWSKNLIKNYIYISNYKLQVMPFLSKKSKCNPLIVMIKTCPSSKK